MSHDEIDITRLKFTIRLKLLEYKRAFPFNVAVIKLDESDANAILHVLEEYERLKDACKNNPLPSALYNDYYTMRKGLIDIP